MGCGASSKAAYRVTETRKASGTLTSELPEWCSGSKSGASSSSEEVGTAKGAKKAGSRENKTIKRSGSRDKVITGGTSLDGAKVVHKDENAADVGKMLLHSKLQSEGLASCTEVMSANLDADSPAAKASDDFAKYKQRKEQRKAAKQKKAVAQGNSFIPRNGFLSNVPELETDVQYRFAFIVICNFADKVVQSVCNCPEAQTHLEGYNSESLVVEDLEDAGPEASSLGARRHSISSTDLNSGVYRCLCPVPYPWGTVANHDMCKLAKLVFRPLRFGQKVPTFDGVLEASNTAFVFIIQADPADNADSLQTQLDNLLKTVKIFKRSPRELRPRWAVIFCHSESKEDAREDTVDPWAAAIDNFEGLHGPLWRFGSMPLEDSDKLYASFAKIASQRIYVNQNPEVELDDPSAAAAGLR